MNPKPHLAVVCAVIEDGSGHVLVAQRPTHKHLALKWEFAGGKVESGESPESALAREIREELGCQIEIVRPLPRFSYDYGDVVIDMMPFVGVLAAGGSPPHPHEHVAIRWIAPTELGEIDLAPADWPVADSYRTGAR